MSRLHRRQPNAATLAVLTSSVDQMRQAVTCLGLSVVGLALGIGSALALHGF